MTTPIDIRADHLRIVQDMLRRHLPDGVKVWVFGSRATWATKDSSDLDLALEGNGEIPARSLAALESALEDSDLPYAVDIVDVKRIDERFREIVTQQRVPLPESPNSHSTDWPVMSLREAGISLIDCEHRTPPASDDGYPYAGIPQIKDGRVDLGGARRIAREHFREWTRKANPRPFDVVLSRRCNPGDTGFVSARSSEFALGQNLVLLRADGEEILKPFLRWLVRSPEWWNQIAKYLNVGAVFDSLKCVDIPEFVLPIPPLPDQRVISRILGTLDDKIELNRRVNATLETMAQALFRSWFVDFDPVRARMEGRDTGLPKEIADLLPDRLVDSDGGEAPEGWPIENLASHFEVMKGVSYKGSGLRGDGMPLHNLNSIHEGGGYKYEGIKFYSGEYAERHSVRPGDVIVANTEQGHDRLLIGYAAIVPGLFGTSGIASHHIYRLRPRSTSWLSTRFLHFLLNSARMHDLVSGYANGTTVNMLPTDGVQRPSFVVPPRALVEAFDLLASCAEQRREQAVCESRTLTVVREALLPKLVSGEMRVGDAEKLVGGTA